MPAHFGLTEQEFEQRLPNIAKLPQERNKRMIRVFLSSKACPHQEVAPE